MVSEKKVWDKNEYGCSKELFCSVLPIKTSRIFQGNNTVTQEITGFYKGKQTVGSGN